MPGLGRTLMSTAIIMAGGRSLRMRATSGDTHKALVKVLGVPMLERNILTLLSHGFREIFLAVNSTESALLTFAKGRATALARAGNAKLKLIVEKNPLGTIGAARALHTTTNALLIVNVDNLTALDLTAFVKHHRDKNAALTIATHTESFQIPFGQVLVKGGKIIAYKEKPLLPVVLSSGSYVLSKKARQIMPRDRTVGPAELVQILLHENRAVESFRHSSPWIDVNDSMSVERAEKLIMSNYDRFELCRQAPERSVAVLCVLKENAVAILEHGVDQISIIDTFPSTQLPAGWQNAGNASDLQHLFEGLSVEKHRILVSFDELDVKMRKWTRYHVITAGLVSPAKKKLRSVSYGTLRWAQLSEPLPLSSHCDACTRTFAYLCWHNRQNSHSVCL